MKGQYQLFLGLIIIISVGVSIGILYITTLKPITQVNQTTTSSSTTTTIPGTTTSITQSTTTTSTTGMTIQTTTTTISTTTYSTTTTTIPTGKIKVDMNTGTFYFNTIDDAIDVCPDNLSEWCKITIPSGTYTLSRKTIVGDTSGVLIAKSNLEIVGAGIGKTILKRDSSVNANLFVVYKKNNVVVRQISLNSSNVNANGYLNLSLAPKPVAIFNSTNVVVDNVEAYYGNAGVAIMSGNISNDILIKNSILHDNGVGGVYVGSVYNITIQDNEIYNTGTKGIHQGEIYKGKIIGNKIHDNLIGMSFDGNNPQNNPQAASHTSQFLVEVSGNSIYHNKAYGIRMIDNITNVTISNNLIFNNNQDKSPGSGGLYMFKYFGTSTEGTRYSTISANQIFDNQSVETQSIGIRVAHNTELNYFIGNVINSTTPWYVTNYNNIFVNNIPQPT